MIDVSEVCKTLSRIVPCGSVHVKEGEFDSFDFCWQAPYRYGKSWETHYLASKVEMEHSRLNEESFSQFIWLQWAGQWGEAMIQHWKGV